MKTIAEKLSEFASNLTYNDIPADVVKRCVQIIEDNIGVACAATRLETVRSIAEMVRGWGGTPSSTIIHFRTKVPAANAAFANGIIAHSLDFDDTHLEGIVHTGSPIIATALAVGEQVDASGKDVITAIVAGWEVMIRLALGARGAFQEAGFHTTSVCGSLAASLVSTKLLNLGQEAGASALGICGSMASGLLEFRTSGSANVKPVHVGWAAHSGIIASELAKAGIRGPHSIIEGPYGLFNSFLKREPDKQTFSEPFDKWETLQISIKPYPACQFTHGYLDCALWLRKNFEIQAEDIGEIECLVPPLVSKAICEPIEEKIRPSTPYSAKFSLPYTIALIMTRGKATLTDFEESRIKDDSVIRVAKKVKCIIDKNSRYPGTPTIASFVKVKTTSGQTFEHTNEANRGSSSNPLTGEEIHDKFLGNAGLVMSEKEGARLAESIASMENLTSVRGLLDQT